MAQDRSPALQPHLLVAGFGAAGFSAAGLDSLDVELDELLEEDGFLAVVLVEAFLGAAVVVLGVVASGAGSSVAVPVDGGVASVVGAVNAQVGQLFLSTAPAQR